MSVIATDQTPAFSIACFQFKRKDLTDATFFGYWKEVHGTYVAAVPYSSGYRQVHFKDARDGLWPDMGSGKYPPPQRATCGFAYFSFASKKAHEDQSRVNRDFAEKDHFNMFQTADDVYRIRQKIHFREDNQAQKQQADGFNIICLFKTTQDTPGTTKFLVDTLCSGLAGLSSVNSVELSLFDTDISADVADDEPSSIHASTSDTGCYSGMLEIALDSHTAWHSEVAQALLCMQLDIERHIETIHAWQLRESIWYVKDGNMTLSGMLGQERARLVNEIGAQNIIAMLTKINAERRRIQASAQDVANPDG